MAILAAFVTLTAIGGGMALLTGAEGDRFPIAWLDGTPFNDYTVPALILAIVVGGSALIATVTVFRGHRSGAWSSITAGILLLGFVTVEALILKQVPPGPTVIEAVYFVVGATIFGLAAYCWRVEHRPT
jgi:hypothetical protein